MGSVRAQALWSGSKPAQTGADWSMKRHLGGAAADEGARDRSAGLTKRHSEVKWKESDAGGRTAPF